MTVSSSDRPGAIAQLGERLPCTQEVSGSTPLSSTINYWVNEFKD